MEFRDFADYWAAYAWATDDYLQRSLIFHPIEVSWPKARRAGSWPRILDSRTLSSVCPAVEWTRLGLARLYWRPVLRSADLPGPPLWAHGDGGPRK